MTGHTDRFIQQCTSMQVCLCKPTKCWLFDQTEGFHPCICSFNINAKQQSQASECHFMCLWKMKDWKTDSVVVRVDWLYAYISKPIWTKWYSTFLCNVCLAYLSVCECFKPGKNSTGYYVIVNIRRYLVSYHHLNIIVYIISLSRQLRFILNIYIV